MLLPALGQLAVALDGHASRRVLGGAVRQSSHAYDGLQNGRTLPISKKPYECKYEQNIYYNYTRFLEKDSIGKLLVYLLFYGDITGIYYINY